MGGEGDVDGATHLQQPSTLGELSGSKDDQAVLAAVTAFQDISPESPPARRTVRRLSSNPVRAGADDNCRRSPWTSPPGTWRRSGRLAVNHRSIGNADFRRDLAAAMIVAGGFARSPEWTPSTTGCRVYIEGIGAAILADGEERIFSAIRPGSR